MEHISKYIHMNFVSDRQNQKIFISFIIGIIIGLLIFWMWSATQKQLGNSTVVEDISPKTNLGTVGETFDTETLVKNDTIIVSNQKAGTEVVITSVGLEEDAWVVVHEGDASYIGNALGAARFERGVHGGAVELLRSTIPGKVYRVILYRDNGDKVFNLEDDFPFLQDGNQPVFVTFMAQ